MPTISAVATSSVAEAGCAQRRINGPTLRTETCLQGLACAFAWGAHAGASVGGVVAPTWTWRRWRSRNNLHITTLLPHLSCLFGVVTEANNIITWWNIWYLQQVDNIKRQSEESKNAFCWGRKLSATAMTGVVPQVIASLETTTSRNRVASPLRTLWKGSSLCAHCLDFCPRRYIVAVLDPLGVSHE